MEGAVSDPQSDIVRAPAAGAGSPRVLVLAVAALACLPAVALAGGKETACERKPCSTVECAAERTGCLIDGGDAEAALDLLKEDPETLREEEEHHLLMARAYLAQGNAFWAIGVLGRALEERPGDCEARSWLVWLYMKDGDLDEAAAFLSDGDCFGGGDEIAARFALLETFHLIQSEGAKAALKKNPKWKAGVKRVFPEDVALYRLDRDLLLPHAIDPLRFKTELSVGYTSNAIMGSPADSTSSGSMESFFIQPDAWVSFVPPLSRWVNPFVDAQIRSIVYLKGFGEKDGGTSPSQFTYLDVGARPGLMFLKDSYPRLTLAYRVDVFLLNKPTPLQEAPVVFYEGHRAEVEIELPRLTFFGGVGRRLFDERVRTRWELDGGIGGGIALWNRLSLLGAVTAHYFMARDKGYNLFGATGLIAATVEVWKGLQFKTVASLGLDNYMDSFGYFNDGKTRKDTSVKVQAHVLSPSWKGLRGGLVYEFSDKLSTIDAYAYMDHRVELELLWSYGFDVFSPRKSGVTPHVPLDYGLGEGGGRELSERIQDLLRQDESITRGTSCVE
jgi:hypothetical protein